MFSKWWALQHVIGGQWVPERITTIFGYPLCTRLFRATGPFKAEQAAGLWCYKENEKHFWELTW